MGKQPDSDKGMRVVLISYIPFFVRDPLKYINLKDQEQIQKIAEAIAATNSSALACVWAAQTIRDDGGFDPTPLFVFDRAEEFCDHLMAWSEDEPTKWFNLHIASKDDKYVIALIPNLEKSIERWKITYQLQTGFPPHKNISFDILFQTPYFVSKSSNSFEKVRHLIGDELKVGFVDSSLVDSQRPLDSMAKLDDSKIRMLGPFKIASNREVQSYLDKILDDVKEPGVTLRR